MSERCVRYVRRNRSGAVTALGNHYEDWSPQRVCNVVRQIETGTHSYFVQLSDRRATVQVLGQAGKQLSTDQDTADQDHINALPRR